MLHCEIISQGGSSGEGNLRLGVSNIHERKQNKTKQSDMKEQQEMGDPWPERSLLISLFYDSKTNVSPL